MLLNPSLFVSGSDEEDEDEDKGFNYAYPTSMPSLLTKETDYLDKGEGNKSINNYS